MPIPIKTHTVCTRAVLCRDSTAAAIFAADGSTPASARSFIPDTMVKKYELFGTDPKGLYLLNQELGARVYSAPSLVL